jgi:hypothetical protein
MIDPSAARQPALRTQAERRAAVIAAEAALVATRSAEAAAFSTLSRAVMPLYCDLDDDRFIDLGQPMTERRRRLLDASRARVRPAYERLVRKQLGADAPQDAVDFAVEHMFGGGRVPVERLPAGGRCGGRPADRDLRSAARGPHAARRQRAALRKLARAAEADRAQG